MEERILAGSRIDEATGCIEWQGALHHSGYGVITVEGKAKRVHRVAYEVAYGSIPNGLLLRHTCNNKICCNPAHLIPGTHAENMKDMIEAGHSLKGEMHHKAKLTEADVLNIRADSRPQREIAKHYGVSQGTIGFIKRRITWSHI